MGISEKSFSKRFNEALDYRGFPPLGKGRTQYVTDAFDLSRSGAHKWLYAKAIPHPNKRKEIAKKLGINLAWLETGMGQMTDVDQTPFQANNIVIKIPSLSMKEAYKIKDAKTTPTPEFLLVGADISKNAFALKYIGESMSPRFYDPCFVIIDPDANISDGDFVAAKITSFPEAMIRQFTQGSDTSYLIALNNKFKPIAIDDKCTILGRVVEIRNTL